MNYIKEAMVTESTEWEKVVARLNSEENVRLLHACMGITTEAGELVDAMKKTLFYGKPLDLVNIQEELGDLFWYIAVACNQLGVSFEEIMKKNIEKLQARYKGGFTEEKALNRDLKTEREILENGCGDHRE